MYSITGERKYNEVCRPLLAYMNTHSYRGKKDGGDDVTLAIIPDRHSPNRIFHVWRTSLVPPPPPHYRSLSYKRKKKGYGRADSLDSHETGYKRTRELFRHRFNIFSREREAVTALTFLRRGGTAVATLASIYSSRRIAPFPVTDGRKKKNRINQLNGRSRTLYRIRLYTDPCFYLLGRRRVHSSG